MSHRHRLGKCAMDLDELLGIDLNDATARRARRLRENDRQLLRDLVKRRQDLDLSQEEVARRMDTNQSTVARIESGARDLHQSTLRRYAMAVEAVVAHEIVPDNRDIARSTEILRDLRDQMTEEYRGSELAGMSSDRVDRVDWSRSRRGEPGGRFKR